MACERYRKTLADVAAGAPAPAGVESHLASCTACREELAALRQALALADAEMAELLSAEPSPGLEARIRRAVAEAEPEPGSRFGWLWPAMAAAATLAVALAGWLWRGPQPTPPVASSSHPPKPAPAVLAVAPAPTREASPAPAPAAVAKAVLRRVPGDEAPPEVLVPPGEAEALQHFAAHLRTRVVTPDSLLVADLSAPLPEPKDVEIHPLEIVPLDPAESSGTD
jgi:hypothetical protein